MHNHSSHLGWLLKYMWHASKWALHNSLLLFSRPSLRVVDVFFLEGLGSVSFASTRHCIFISASAGGCQSLVEVFALDPLLVFVSFFRIFPSPFCYSVWRKHASMAPPFLLLKGNCTDYFLNFSLPPLPVRNEIVRRSLDASRLLFRSALLVYQVPMAVFTKVCRSEISCSLNLLHQVCMAGLCLCPLSLPPVVKSVASNLFTFASQHRNGGKLLFSTRISQSTHLSSPLWKCLSIKSSRFVQEHLSTY